MVIRYDDAKIPSVYRTDDVPANELRPGFTIRAFRSLTNLIGFVHAEPGAERSLHEHPWEQVVHVADGATDFYVDGEEVALERGDVMFIPPDVKHELRPKSDESVDLVVVWPLREDFLEQTSYQAEFYGGTDG